MPFSSKKEIKLPDGNSLVLPFPVDAAIDPAVAGMQALVDGLCGKNKITIEFECGDCCKKVSNGAFFFFFFNFVVLLPSKDEFLTIKLFNGGNLVEKEKAKVIVIESRRICSFEFGPKKEKKKVNKKCNCCNYYCYPG